MALVCSLCRWRDGGIPGVRDMAGDASLTYPIRSRLYFCRLVCILPTLPAGWRLFGFTFGLVSLYYYAFYTHVHLPFYHGSFPAFFVTLFFILSLLFISFIVSCAFDGSG